MTATPREESAPIPPGYSAGDYVPFKDRDPSNPSAIAGQWADTVQEIQQGGGRKLTAEEQFRAIYGNDVRQRSTVYALWFRRVLGRLVDGLVTGFASIPLIVGYVMKIQEMNLHTDPVTGQLVPDPNAQTSSATGLLLMFGAIILLVFVVWNEVVRQGRTGYTIGKTVVGIRLVKEVSGRPVGIGWALLRYFAHYVDSFLCYVGWFWPLWDAKRQTLADKIVGSVVIVQRQVDAGL